MERKRESLPVCSGGHQGQGKKPTDESSFVQELEHKNPVVGSNMIVHLLIPDENQEDKFWAFLFGPTSA